MNYSKSMKVFVLDSVRASLPEIPGLKTIPDPLGLIEEAEKKIMVYEDDQECKVLERALDMFFDSYKNPMTGYNYRTEPLDRLPMIC